MKMVSEVARQHNHFTRDIKPFGECDACDIFHDAERVRSTARRAMLELADRADEATRRFVALAEALSRVTSSDLWSLRRMLVEDHAVRRRGVARSDIRRVIWNKGTWEVHLWNRRRLYIEPPEYLDG